MTEAVKVSQALKPCPFCGATPDDDCTHVVPYGEPGLTLYKVVCTCGAANEGGFTETEAITAWNTRHEATAKLVEALEEITRIVHSNRSTQRRIGLIDAVATKALTQIRGEEE